MLIYYLNVYLIVKNGFISVFIKVFLYIGLLLAQRLLVVRYPLTIFIITSSKLMP